MNKEQILEKLKELGIKSDNCYPKSSFLHQGEVVVALYSTEMREAFYFYNKYDKKIYGFFDIPEDGLFLYDLDKGTDKYLVPMSVCKLVWEDKPFEELKDIPFKEMTLRQYTCIHLGVPETGIGWLDSIITKSSNNNNNKKNY